MTKPRILVLSEFSDLSTGYAAYCRELLTALHEKYEVAEFARYIGPDDPRIYQKPWKVYPVVPSREDSHGQDVFKSDQQNIFGKHLFERVCIDFRPSVVISPGDFWQENWIDTSPFRDKFHWIWLVTADAPQQHEEWMDVYSRVDSLFTYNDWSKETLEVESNNRLTIISETPSSVSEDFKPLDKKAIKQAFGLGDKYIIGTVMRNQKRKDYPGLFESFRKFLDKTERTDILLYCHTSYPDFGWDIPKLINKHGISSKTLFTYRCQQCGYFFPSFFSDIVTFCNRCNSPSASMCSVKNGLSTKEFAVIYNLFDLYIQFAFIEGLGIPPIEAAACGVPVMEVDFSAMKDVVRKLNGTPIDVKYEFNEIETGRLWGMPDYEDFIQKLTLFFNKPESLIKTEGTKALSGQKKNYNWDKTIKKWLDLIETINTDKYDLAWKSQPRFIDTNIKMPQKCSNSTFVNLLLRQLLPRLSNTYLETKLIRQLNLGITHMNPFANFGDDTSILGRSSVQGFTRGDCIKFVMDIVNKYNHWESIRSQNVQN